MILALVQMKNLTEFFPQYEKKDASSFKLQIDSAEVKAFSKCLQGSWY